MATKRKSHKAVGKAKTCPICKKNHTKSEHLSHGKGSFHRFPSRKKTTKKTAKMSKAKFIRQINKGRKKAGLKPIKAKR